MRTLVHTLRLKQSIRIAPAARVAVGRCAGTRTSAAPATRRAPARLRPHPDTSRHYAARRLAAQWRTRRI